MWIQPYTKAQDSQGTRSQGQITLDARNSTEYGLLRSFVSLGLAKRNGAEQSGSQERQGNASIAANDVSTSKQTFFNYQAYIQLGGFTAGRMTSFLAPSFGFNDLVGAAGVDGRDPVSQVAYTVSLGNGFSVTGAIEDGSEANRDGVLALKGDGTGAASTTYYKAPSLIGGQSVAGNTKIGTLTYGGNRIPDAVLAMNLDQAWGSAHIAASTHTLNYSNVWTVTAAGFNAVSAGNLKSTDYGYALNAALKIKLDMIAAGDNLNLQAAYASGYNQAVLRNVIGDRQTNDGAGIYGYNAGYNAAGTINDAVYNLATNKTDLAQAYGGSGEFTHYFTPTVAVFAGAGYAKLNYSSAAQAAGYNYATGPADSTYATNVNPTAFTTAWVGAIWTPVKGFKVVPEAFYVTQTSKYAYAPFVAEKSTKTIDSWQGRFRVTREF
jgi:hypothetical protein